MQFHKSSIHKIQMFNPRRKKSACPFHKTCHSGIVSISNEPFSTKYNNMTKRFFISRSIQKDIAIYHILYKICMEIEFFLYLV